MSKLANYAFGWHGRLIAVHTSAHRRTHRLRDPRCPVLDPVHPARLLVASVDNRAVACGSATPRWAAAPGRLRGPGWGCKRVDPVIVLSQLEELGFTEVDRVLGTRAQQAV